MPDTQQKVDSSKRHKYLTAILFIIIFIIAVPLIDKVINYIINTYLPQYTSYIAYIAEGLNALLALIVTYIIYKILLSILNAREPGQSASNRSETGKTVLRVLFYIAVLSILLVSFGPSLGITLSQSLAGGAIGGIILGLAVQTIVTSLLAGFLVSSSKTLVPGEIVVLHSSIWGGDMICKVVKVNMMFTEVITQTANHVKVPNAPFVNNVTFTKLKSANCYIYTTQISVATDVSATELDKKVRIELKENLSKIKKTMPQIFLFARTSSQNTFNVTISFSDFSEINQILHVTNLTFDKVYWDLKNQQQAVPQVAKPPKKRKRK